MLGRYVQPLQSVLLLKLLWNLSSAYYTVKIGFLKDLADGLGMTFEDVEKSVVLFTQTHKGLAVRIDHRSGCLRFGDVQMESDDMRSQLTILGQQLETVVTALAPDSSVAQRCCLPTYTTVAVKPESVALPCALPPASTTCMVEASCRMWHSFVHPRRSCDRSRLGCWLQCALHP